MAIKLVARGDGVRLMIPDHELLRVIGQGAYGQVWLARSVLGTFRAVKLIRRSTFEDAAPYEREFNGIRRFEPLSRTNDGLVDILQVGRDERAGHFYYVMELADPADGAPGRISGLDPVNYAPRTLRSELRKRGSLPVQECIALGLRLTSALEHLHSHGLVHRDIKPSNVIFVGGQPKLADIGLIAEIEEANSFVGTAGYLPPEGPGKPRADLFSLGKVLYEMSTGKDRQEFPRLPANWKATKCDSRLIELNEIVLRACDPDPEKRYPSAAAMRLDFDHVHRGRSLQSRRLRHSLTKTLVIAAGSSALLLTAALLWNFQFTPRLTHSPPAIHAMNYEIQSSVPGVNELVAQGNVYILSETRERIQNASKCFTSAIEKDPNCLSAHFGLFRVRLNENSALPDPLAEASGNLQASVDQMKKIDPNSAEARIATSFILSAAGRAKEARAEAEQAIRAQARSKESAGIARWLYGCYLLESGDSHSARVQFLAAKRVLAGSPVIVNSVGLPYFLERKFDEALAHFEGSIELEPRHSLGYFWIGRVYEEQGEFLRAIDSFEKARIVLGGDEHSTRAFYEDLRSAVKADPLRGYWRKRLELALAEPRTSAYQVATLYLHLNEIDQAYELLSRLTFEDCDGKLWIDPCWNREDPRYVAYARKFGLRSDAEE